MVLSRTFFLLPNFDRCLNVNKFTFRNLSKTAHRLTCLNICEKFFSVLCIKEKEKEKEKNGTTYKNLKCYTIV